MPMWNHNFGLIKVFVLTLAVILITSCFQTSTPMVLSPTSTPALVFSYQVRVRDRDSGENILDAQVTIDIEGKASLISFTDSEGIARSFVYDTHANRPGWLIVTAEGYQIYRRNIDLTQGSLPTVIQLEPGVDSDPIAPDEPPTESPPVVPADEPIVELDNKIEGSTTGESTVESVEQVVAELTEVTILIQSEQTGESVSQAQITISVVGKAPIEATSDANGMVTISINPSYIGESGELRVQAPEYQNYTSVIDLVEGALPNVINLRKLLSPTPKAPTPTPALGGQLAIPLLFGASHKVYVVDVNANVRGIIDAAQQPDFTRDGTRLILNGVGNDLNKLRLSDPTGKSWQEIGDPSLAGHSHPAWSPDGTQVVYDDNTLGCGNWCLYTRAINDNQGEGAIVTAAGNRFIINDNPLYPLWTTNNRLIFRGCNTWAVAGGGGTCGIWSMQGNGGNPERLTEMAGIPTDVLDNLLAFTFQNDVYRLNIATGEVKQLTFDPANDGLAAISPNGNWVAFLSNRGGQLAVWYAGINGGTPQKMFDIPQQWGTLLPNGWFDERLSWAN